jgi:hypothetical protein
LPSICCGSFWCAFLVKMAKMLEMVQVLKNIP